MKKKLVNFLVFVLLLSFVFQSSSASAISTTKVIDPEPQVVSDSVVLAEAPIPETPEQPDTLEPMIPLEPYLPEHRLDSEDRYAEMLLDPDLPEEIRAHLMAQTEPVEKPEYVPPTPEVIAETQKQVESFSCADITDVRQFECEALVSFYNSTNGAGWVEKTNWLTSNNVGDWYGVSISNGHVSGLRMDNNNLNGTLPPDLVNLGWTQEITLTGDHLTGPIPAWLGNLGGLKILNLSFNPFGGIIPKELGYLYRLEVLDLGFNGLTGSIPPELGNLSNLEELSLHDNHLTGSIPPELGNLTKLDHLNLSVNSLTNTIPAELGKLTNLGSLFLYENQLIGHLPPELGNLSNLTKLLLWDNNLTGPIPLSFVHLPLLVFYFGSNSLCEPQTAEFLAWKATVASYALNSWSGTNIVCVEPVTGSWLIMYYLDGDNNLSSTYHKIFNQIEKGVGNAEVTVVVLWDDIGGDNSSYYKIINDDDPIALATYEQGVNKWTKGEVNMGDPKTLSDFLVWATTTYPAENYALVLDDHGSGLGGGMVDDTSNHDKLSLSEIKTAISSAFFIGAKLDVLVMNACLMGLIENGYQFKDLVSYYVASEDLQTTFYDGYANTLDKILVSSTPQMVAIAFVDGYADEMEAKGLSYTMSVANLEYSEDLKSALFGFTDKLFSELSEYANKLWDYRNLFVQKFPSQLIPALLSGQIYIDLRHYADLVFVSDLFGLEINNAALEVISRVDEYIIYNRSSLEHAYGASIFFPNLRSSYYDGDNNDFAFGTIWDNKTNSILGSSTQTVSGGWGNLLVGIFEVVDPGGPDNPNEPDPVAKPIYYELYLPSIVR